MSQHMSRADPADTLHPAAPNGNDPDVASAVFNTAVQRTLDMTNELQAMADSHFDAAPTTSLHVLKLNRAIARTVLDWIEQWSR
jgi:hypothetical protein